MTGIVINASFLIFALPVMAILMARHNDSTKLDTKDEAVLAGYAGITVLSFIVF